MRTTSITISSSDYSALVALVDSARLDRRIPTESVKLLERELSGATIVAPSELPPDVVAMNSTVWFRDVNSDEIEKYTLVYPAEADVMRDRISVLAPIGTALLGYRTGDVVPWRVPSGTRRIEIVDVTQNVAEPRFDQAAAVA